MMRAQLLASILLALQSPACAQTIGLHLATAHQRGGYEAVTPGLYWRGPTGATAGLLRNSEARLSGYAGWTWQRGALGLTVGGITGYSAAPIYPLLVPSLRLPLGQGAALRVSAIPKPHRAGSAALHLSIEW